MGRLPKSFLITSAHLDIAHFYSSLSSSLENEDRTIRGDTQPSEAEADHYYDHSYYFPFNKLLWQLIQLSDLIIIQQFRSSILLLGEIATVAD